MLLRHWKLSRALSVSPSMAPAHQWGDYDQAYSHTYPGSRLAYNAYSHDAYDGDGGHDARTQHQNLQQQPAYQQAYGGWQNHDYDPLRAYANAAQSRRAPWPSETDGYVSRPDQDDNRQSELGCPSTPPSRPDTKRVRTPTPPPPPPPRSPSPSYLAQADEPSSQLEDPTDVRKLLILDLNGSLLIRAAHKRARGYDPYAGNSQRALRSVHPRPYMAVFRAYLLHPETRKWLDVMVWSSAQPHSVADMVGNCFGAERDKLVAVWARDTLGLSKADYRA